MDNDPEEIINPKKTLERRENAAEGRDMGEAGPKWDDTFKMSQSQFSGHKPGSKKSVPPASMLKKRDRE